MSSFISLGIPTYRHLGTTINNAFREVIPQAVSVRYGLSIGARCVPLVLGMMFIFAPIAWPIAKVLDWMLGTKEQHTYKKTELKSFLQFHRSGDEPLRDEEITILNGVLELNTKKVEELMTPLADTVVLSTDDVLDYAAVHAILQTGYSRFPVHEKGNRDAFVGILLVKKASLTVLKTRSRGLNIIPQLLTYDPNLALPVSAFPLSVLPEASPSINCFKALEYLQAEVWELSHSKVGPGIVIRFLLLITSSTSDIIEEMISKEIIDETDRYEDNHSKRRARRRTTPSVLESIFESSALGAGTNSEVSSLLTVDKSAVPEEMRTMAYGGI
ncbi:hypothetical protein D9613_001350 [Agrocybe pediades]|uniref:CNNM transmembrane domain-containing protein n=1 Tax=Agrocybe pediades TaxID=84607 RepID=A0A8H4R4Q8_9AGAR|nr:hypothetical protein D9613_001350 [Agrocybe pediades]